eukprot:TRINITY_DN121112_c0_g1_i1.p1 TRINITY_DN121112_c0_g1~~TRINITY_DN121112_c0_g1_i1.p1  ORF type:complete len:770 (-),score=172.63 TRINITY_DN121112_c0_g1_i1:166-2475(-)
MASRQPVARTATRSVKLSAIDKEIHRFQRLVERLLRREAAQRLTAPPLAPSDADGDSAEAASSSPAEVDIIPDFEAEWETEFGDDPTGYFEGEERTWYNYRGDFGETILQWIEFMKSVSTRGTALGDILMALSKQLLRARPELFSLAQQDGEFAGQTLLLQACANGDEETVDFYLEYATVQDLNVYATGRFITSKLLCSGYPEVAWHTASLLEVAAVAPVDGDVAIRLVTKLMENGADAFHCGVADDDEGTPRLHSKTLLHRLAICRWRVEPSNAEKFELADAEIMEAERLRGLLAVVFNPPKPKKGAKAERRLSRAQTSARLIQSHLKEHSFTPIQTAAIVGNDIFIIEYIRQKQIVEWRWGHRRAIKLPLLELDCSTYEQRHLSVMELLVLFKHRGTMELSLFVDVITRKWDKFGFKMTCKNIILQVVYSSCVTLGCFEHYGTLGNANRDISRISRRLAILMGTFFSCSRIMSHFIARHTGWNKSLHYFSSARVLGMDQVPRFVDVAVFILGLVVLAMHELELWMDTKHQGVLTLLDGMSAVFIWVAWFSVLRFLKLFQSTTVLASVVPVVVMRDMPPWMFVWVVMTIGTAGAIRTSLWHDVHHTDEVIGTFWRTTMTLEEATHGPDVQWRNIVMNQPFMASVFFLIFLWVVTIIMMNLLITIFSSTFEARKAKAFSELVYWRAVQVISCEKGLPIWLHSYWGLRLGHPADADEAANAAAAGVLCEATPLLSRMAPGVDPIHWLERIECIGYTHWDAGYTIDLDDEA